MRFANRCLALLLLGALPLPAAAGPSSPTAAPEGPPLRRDGWHLRVELHPDLTYVETITQDYTLRTRAGVALADRDDVTVHPATQTLTLLAAEVRQPDGTVLPVPPSAQFSRPSQADQDTPGFSGAMTTTVLFPQLTAGSRTHVEWRIEQTKPSPLGFNLAVRPLLEWPTSHMTVEIVAPAALKLDWSMRGGWHVSETVSDGQRHILAAIDDVAGEAPERNMVAATDFLPMFAASTLGGPAALGAAYYRQALGRAAVTPAIAARAAEIVGDRKGVEAARAIHDWIATNIRYVALFLDANDGWVPHAADEVLARGYGDCKDHVVLFQALLAARGIRAEAALIDWGPRYVPYPQAVPQQFNHVIAWLPDYDLYANPTNPFAKLGALDRRLAGKMVVIATEAGEVRQTPPSRPADNRYRLDAELSIGADGTVTGSAGYAMDADIEAGAREDVAAARSPRELAERMLSATPEGGAGDIAASDPKDLARPFRVESVWLSPHGVTLQGNEAYFSTPVGIDFEQVTTMLRPYVAADGPRRHAVLAAAADLGWRYAIHLPEGFALARLPPERTLSNAAGSYESRYERGAGGDVVVTRHLVVDRDVYPAEEYADLRALFYAALDDSRGVFVLTRLEAAK
jgi:transglutaminase-like putative cysteine protease